MRRKRRVPCEFEIDGQSWQGLVTEVSLEAFFVRTTAPVRASQEITLRLAAATGYPAMTLRARVTRIAHAPARMASLVPRGLGMEVIDAPPAWEALVKGDVPSEPDPEASSAPRFRIRLADEEGYAYRTLIVEAADAAEAEAEAMEEVGPEWKILSVDPA